MKQRLPLKEIAALGFLMFALFLGAGNLIFPPLLGQQAGEDIWLAILGFLVTGVGLPLLAVITISQVKGDLHQLSIKVHPLFAMIFPIVVYLAIGPFFGIPRTGTVVYEIGVVPFLTSSSQNGWSLFVSTFVFFLLTFWLALNPAKLVDRVGKILTPLLLIFIAIISVRGVASPLGQLESAVDKYSSSPFFSGFLEGYLTMDAIAALVFGIVIINRLKEKEIVQQVALRAYTIKAGIVAGLGLSFVYVALAYLGATSVETIGHLDNGGAILSSITASLFGPVGTVLLALVIILACLTTSIGLVSACGEFLTQRFNGLSYPVIIAVICLFSLTMANLGLSQLIAVSLPVLVAIYPIAIVLITLSLIDSFIRIPRSTFIGAITFASVISVYDGLVAAGMEIISISSVFENIPLFTNGVGWLLPSIIGAIIGTILHNKNNG